jgi:hypothetical protein
MNLKDNLGFNLDSPPYNSFPCKFESSNSLAKFFANGSFRPYVSLELKIKSPGPYNIFRQTVPIRSFLL